MVRTKSEVVTLLQEHVSELKAFGVRRYGIFGAFRHDRAHEESDVDLLVEFESDKKISSISATWFSFWKIYSSGPSKSSLLNA